MLAGRDRQRNLDKVNADDQARKEQERQLARAAKAREAFVAELLQRPVKVHASARDLLADLVGVALDRQESDAVKLTCRLLGLQPLIKRGDSPGVRADKDYRGPVARYAADPSKLGRVARALWLSQGEFRARWTYSPWSPMVLAYLDQLVEAGYILSPVERQRYDEARQAATAGEQATSGEEPDAQA